MSATLTVDAAFLEELWLTTDPATILAAGVSASVIEEDEIKVHTYDGDCFFGNNRRDHCVGCYGRKSCWTLS